MRNKFEKRINRQLKRAKVRFGYETDRIQYVLVRSYIPDFIIETDCGRRYVECKGWLRPEDKSKLLAVKAQVPNIDLRILFYARNKKNIKWAEKHGFVYAFEKIPKEWLT